MGQKKIAGTCDYAHKEIRITLVMGRNRTEVLEKCTENAAVKVASELDFIRLPSHRNVATAQNHSRPLRAKVVTAKFAKKGREVREEKRPLRLFLFASESSLMLCIAP